MSRARIKGMEVGQSRHPGRASQTVGRRAARLEAFLISTHLEKITDRVVGGGRECCVDVCELSSATNRPVSHQSADVGILAPQVQRGPLHRP